MNIFSESIILIPTLREKDNLRNLLPAIFDLMPDISVLVTDDNSGDGTVELIQDFKKNFTRLFLLERKDNFGYGKAILDGMRWIAGKDYNWVITMDSDFSHDFKDIPEIIKKLQDKDVVLGSRYINGGKIENWSFFRKFLSRFANFYVDIVLGTDFSDSTTGFVGYNKTSIKKLIDKKPTSGGYAFLVESKYVLSKDNLKFCEHPITFRERRQGQSKMSYKIIWESIWMPWKLKLQKR